MPSGRFTFVCEYDGGTYVAQVQANDEIAAVVEWGELHRRDKPAGSVSEIIASAVAEEAKEPTPLTGLADVWCWTAVVDDRLLLTNIVRSALAP